MSRRRIAISLTALALLSGCGGKGPGVRGPEAVDLFRSFSGTWELDEGSSSDEPAPGQPPGGVAGRAPGAGVGGGEGRAGGTRGGGTRGGGGRGGVGGFPGEPGGAGDGFPGRGAFRGAIDTEAMFAASELARRRPATIELALSDSLFVADYEGGVKTEVPMTGEQVQMEVSRQPTKAWVEWREGKPRLTWEVEDGGHVTDRFEVLPTGRLALSRVFNNGFGGDVEVRFVYSRRSSASGGR
jgi:hypothetical protein